MLLHNEGVALQKRGRLKEAREKLSAAVKAFRKDAAARRELAASLSQLSQVCFGLEDVADAVKHVKESVLIRTELSDFRGLCIDYQMIGTLMLTVGQYGEASGFFRDSLGLATGLKDNTLIATALSNRGIVALYQERYPEARSWFERSQKIREAEGDRLGIAKNKNHLGKIAEAEGNRDKAAELYEESLAALRELGVPEAKIAQQNLRDLR